MLVSGHELGAVTDADGSGSDDPAVECQLAVEAVPDAAEDVRVVLRSVRIDGGHDTTLTHRVDADEGVADGQCLTRPASFGVTGDAGEEEVGPQSTDVVAERVDCAVGGDEQVEHVEPLGSVIGGEPRVGTGVASDDGGGGWGVPRFPGDAGMPSRPVLDGMATSACLVRPVSGPCFAADVDDSVAADAVDVEASVVERFTAEGLHGIAPQTLTRAWIVPWLLDGQDVVSSLRAAVLFGLPLGGDGGGFVSSLQELGSVSPHRVGGVHGGDALGVSGVPGILGGVHLGGGAGVIERRHGWSGRQWLVGHGGHTATTGKSMSTPAALLK